MKFLKKLGLQPSALMKKNQEGKLHQKKNEEMEMENYFTSCSNDFQMQSDEEMYDYLNHVLYQDNPDDMITVCDLNELCSLVPDIETDSDLFKDLLDFCSGKSDKDNLIQKELDSEGSGEKIRLL